MYNNKNRIAIDSEDILLSHADKWINSSLGAPFYEEPLGKYTDFRNSSLLGYGTIPYITSALDVQKNLPNNSMVFDGVEKHAAHPYMTGHDLLVDQNDLVVGLGGLKEVQVGTQYSDYNLLSTLGDTYGLNLDKRYKHNITPIHVKTLPEGGAISCANQVSITDNNQLTSGGLLSTTRIGSSQSNNFVLSNSGNSLYNCSGLDAIVQYPNLSTVNQMSRIERQWNPDSIQIPGSDRYRYDLPVELSTEIGNTSELRIFNTANSHRPRSSTVQSNYIGVSDDVSIVSHMYGTYSSDKWVGYNLHQSSLLELERNPQTCVPGFGWNKQFNSLTNYGSSCKHSEIWDMMSSTNVPIKFNSLGSISPHLPAFISEIQSKEDISIESYSYNKVSGGQTFIYNIYIINGKITGDFHHFGDNYYH